MKDRRLYARFTLDFMDHPKIAILSDGAFRTLVDATIWSRRLMTDGFLARRLALARWSLENLRELCNNDDEKPSLIEREEGWYIHDFADEQDTKAEIVARQERAKAAGQKGGLARAKRPAKRPAKRNPTEMLSENVAETETKTEITTTGYVPPQTHQSNAREPKPGGAEIARARFAAIPATTDAAYRVAQAFSASLPTPIETGMLGEVAVQIEHCLRSGNSPPAIAAGLQAWTASDSWHPSQIPKFVHKANNRRASTNGKPTAKALGIDQALAELLQEVQTL